MLRNMRTEFRGLSGSALKWIALFSMAVDHIGACILEVFVLNGFGTCPYGGLAGDNWNRIYQIDQALRAVGRFAFPIFCFLLVEGFAHTHDVKKYALRLSLFALVSEIPFDLALKVDPFYWEYQNVFFTLLAGLLAIWLIDAYNRALPATALGLAGGMLLAEVLHTDYGAAGVGLIVVLYLFRGRRLLQCVCGAVWCLWELPAPLAFVPVYFYNGERGRQPKWFFYWFYPLHLLLYFAIGMWVLPMVVG